MKARHATRCGARGFTLIELMVTLSIMAIMMAIAVPSFRSFVNGQRVKSAATEIMTAVLIARSDAIKRNASVTITPTDAADWAKGWTVTVGAATLHQQEAIENVSATTYTNAICTSAGSVPTVVFSNTGRPASASCFKFTADASTTARCVKVDLTGIPSSGSC